MCELRPVWSLWLGSIVSHKLEYVAAIILSSAFHSILYYKIWMPRKLAASQLNNKHMKVESTSTWAHEVHQPEQNDPAHILVESAEFF